VTPTGAALLLALDCRYGPFPAMGLAATGYGAGSRNPPARPNVLPAMLGTPSDHQGKTAASQLLIKVGPHRAKPEHDDVLEVAAASGLPAQAIADLAQAAIASQRTAGREEI
jgi:uncharacterized protein (DUF111 family)